MPKADIIVFRRSICEGCIGTGRQRHGLWSAYWQAAKLKTVAELMEFMQANGQPSVPAELVACPQCSGMGYHDKPIALAEVLAEIQK